MSHAVFMPLRANEWEILATVWMPEYVGEKDYVSLAIIIVALNHAGVYDRFTSVRAMAEWCSVLLGWEVGVEHIRVAIERVKKNVGTSREPERYLDMLGHFTAEHAAYLEAQRKKYIN